MSLPLLPRPLRLPALVAAALLLAVAPARAQQTDDVPRVTNAYALVNARIVQAPGRVIERGTVVVRDGLITAVGADVAVPYDAERIEADSLVVYPGFIDGLSHAGIPRPKADAEERERVDDPGNPPNDRAGVEPERHVRDFLDPADESVEDLRKAGFTAAHVVPHGRMLPGSGAIILLGGTDAGQMVLKPDVSLFAQFETARGVYPGTPMGILAKMRQLYREAERRKRIETLYAENPAGMERPLHDPVHAAFYPVIDGAKPVFFYVKGREGALEAHRALTLQETLGFPLALAGLNQAHALVDELRAADVPLFLTLALPEETKEKKDGAADTLTVGVDTSKAVTPPAPGSFFVRDFRTRSYEDIEDEEKNLKARRALVLEEYYGAPARLHEAGLAFGFTTMDAKAADLQANLRKIVEHGLPEDVALAALTTEAARLLGVDRSLGTVETGKIANLIVTTKPYFEEGSKVRHVFVDGVPHTYDTAKKPKAANGAVNPAGSWSYTVVAPDGTVGGTLTLTGSPGSLSGTITNDMSPEASTLENVVLDGSELTFGFDAGSFGYITARLTMGADEFDGMLTVPGLGEAPITGTRTSGPGR